MNQHDSIEIIGKMIAASKQNYKNHAPIYLLWGWLVFAAAVIEFVLLVGFDFEWHFLVWPIFMSAGALISMVLGAKAQKRAGAKTYIDRALSYLWGGWIILLIIIILYAIVLNKNWGESYALLITIYGLGTFISGGILKFKPLVIGGLMSFAIAILCILLNLTSHFPVMLVALALSIVVSYLIPGYLLRKA